MATIILPALCPTVPHLVASLAGQEFIHLSLHILTGLKAQLEHKCTEIYIIITINITLIFKLFELFT